MDKPAEIELCDLYYNQGLTQTEIAERFDTHQRKVSEWMREYDIAPGRGGRIPIDTTKEEIYDLYYNQGLSQTAIGERFGVHQTIISKRMREWGIAPGKRFDLAAKARKVPWATFGTNHAGYEVWRARDGETMHTVTVHRLAAVAWYGLEAVAGNVIHHKNDIRWDNREDNIEVMSDSEHKRLHAERWARDNKGMFAFQ